MSYTEYHRGILIPVDEDPENFAKDYIITYNSDVDGYSSHLEALLNIYYDKFTLIKNKLYRIKDEDLVDDYGMISKNPDGSISYYISFYNGGACLNEALKYLVESNSYGCYR